MRVAIAAAALLAGLAGTSASAQQRLEVVHFLTGAGKQPGLQLLAKELAGKNVVWVDNMIADPNTARSVAINRMLSGDPPGVLQFNAGKPLQELVDQGLLRDVDAVAASADWKDNLTPALLAALTYKGHIYGVPVYSNTPVFLWYNKEVFARLGLSEPTTWDDVFAAAAKLKAAGVMPFSFSKEGWTRQHLFQAVLSSAGGRDLYYKFYKDRDAAAVLSPAFLRVATILGELRDEADPGSRARSADQAVGLLASGKAGMMFLNDQNAKSEFAGAGKVAGKDYGCALLGEHPLYVQDTQIFVLPKTGKPAVDQAQDTLAALIGSAKTQTDLAALWTTTPARTDVDLNRIDVCSRIAVGAMRDVSKTLPTNAWLGVSPDMRESLGDILNQYWSKPSMTADDFAKSTAAALKDFPKGT
jgi:glucose/mannose transport system substrate-binding protein